MSELNAIIDRMKQATNSETDTALGQYFNLKSSSAVSTWRLRKRVPISECYTISKRENISMDWLLYGTSQNESDMAVTNNIAVADSADSDIVTVKEYDIRLSAGAGSYPQEHPLVLDRRPFSKEWLLKKGLKPENLVLTRVSGESMEPMLKDKDIVMIDTAQTVPNDAMPFAVRVDDTLYIKRVVKQGHKLTLLSINPMYTPLDIDLKASHCEILGAVVWHAHSWI